MILEDICLLAADTSRSKAYLTSLHKLIPALILSSNNDIKNLPGNTKERSKENNFYTGRSETLFDTTMNIENFDFI